MQTVLIAMVATLVSVYLDTLEMELPVLVKNHKHCSLELIISFFLTVFFSLSYADINECEVTTDLCGMNADCSNIEGSYECTCVTGYTTDGFGTCIGTV